MCEIGLQKVYSVPIDFRCNRLAAIELCEEVEPLDAGWREPFAPIEPRQYRLCCSGDVGKAKLVLRLVNDRVVYVL